MKGLHRNLAIAVLIIGGFLFAQSDAATFTVNSTVDAVDVNPGDGLCETANASECTLRAAIQETNALVGSDVVTLPAGTYVLNVGGWREDAASTGDLDVTDDLSIVGAGAGSTVIDGNKGDRIFDVFPPAQVSISFLSIQNGDLNELYFPEHGGGIRNLSVLTLGGVDVSNNNANTDMGNGGGIFNTGDLYLTDVAISGNMASQYGGALFCYYSSRIHITNSTIVGNRAQAGGTGLACDSYMQRSPNTITIISSIVRNGENQVWNNDRSTIAITYGNVEEGTGQSWFGIGCIDVEPSFVIPGYWNDNGTPDSSSDDFWVDGDYHLKSEAGRWDSTSGSWLQDDVTSPCIDAGDPSSPIGLEPFPNGARINMGAYGGTAEASKSYFGTPICQTIIAGDLNGDCTVDSKDFVIIASHWLDQSESEQ